MGMRERKKKEREKMPPCFVAKAPLKLTREFYFMEQEKKSAKVQGRKRQRKKETQKEKKRKEREEKKTELTTRIAVRDLHELEYVVYGKYCIYKMRGGMLSCM